MKGKVVIDSDVKDSCYQVEKLTECVNLVMSAGEKISRDLIIVKNTNTNFENSILALEKLQTNTEQYDRRYNIEIPNEVVDKNIEHTVIRICHLILTQTSVGPI